METLGFIGLGNMGSGMTRNLIKAGYRLVAYDVQKDKLDSLIGPQVEPANSPAEVASAAEVIFTSLPGPDEVKAVAIEGPYSVLNGIKPNSVYVDLSTIRPSLIRSFHPLFKDKHAHVMDAPVSGGKMGAVTRNLAVMVGGEHHIYQRIKPILEAIGDKVFYAGQIGAGTVSKLVHNMINHGVRQAIAEGLTLGVKAGVEPELLWECIRRGSLGRMSFLHERIPATVFRDQYDPPSFTLSLSLKDISLATELGKEYMVPMPVASLAEQIAIEAINRGWGASDMNITVRLQEEAAGVGIRAPSVPKDKGAGFISTHPEND